MPSYPLPVRADPQDGEPAWDPPRGTPLVPGALTWYRLGVGYRREAWLCWSVALWEPVVVKLVRPVWTRPRSTRALEREVRALRRVRRPGLPTLLADGLSSPLPHLVTDYFNGPPLDEVAASDGPVPAAEVAHLAVDLLAAVRYLHAAGLAHLDICPDNVVVVEHRGRLIDLGAARPLGTRPRRGEAIGTEGFLAPELEPCDGTPITAAMDLYGVGATLRHVVDAASDATGVVLEVIERLTDPDPGRRPTPEAALATLVRAAAAHGSRPWPFWADRHLGARPPRPRRPVRGGAGAVLPLPARNAARR